MRCLILLFVLPCLLLAQPERYELGKRLKAFELAWEKQPDAAVRKQALKIIEKVTPQFFSGSFGEAGRTLDEARWVLEKKTPTDAEKWLTCLQFVPEKRIFDHTESTMSVNVKQFYKPKVNQPANIAIRLRVPECVAVEVPIEKLPINVRVPITNPQSFQIAHVMDRIAFVSMIADGRVLCESEFGFSVCYKLADSVAGLKKSLAAAKGRHDWLACTARDSLERIEGVLAGDVGDTDVPANMLLSQVQFLAENWATNNEKMEKFQEDFFVERLTSPGAHYLAFPAEKKRSHVVRVWIPENPEKKPRPLVVALHGAGGSENMFPEAYGHGQIAKECQARGWYLLCPHSGLAFGTSPVSAIVEEFAKQFPVDPKAVFLVGHSMGAAQAIAVVQDQPERFAAVAALGGGGRVSKPEAFKSIPVFIGVGDKDFALGGAKALAKSLPKAIYKEYPDFEHLVIVREALPDVFKEWDKLVKPRGPVKEN